MDNVNGIEVTEPGKARMKIKSNVAQLDDKRKSKKAEYAGNYKISNGCLVHVRSTAKNVIETVLCDFDAKIIEVKIFDDGLQRRSVYVIQGKHCSGKDLPTIEVPADKFHSGAWIAEFWGLLAFVEPTNSSLRHTTAAVHKFSTCDSPVPFVESKAYLGWVKTNQGWIYLTSTGAMTKKGLDKTINVILTGNMSRYQLPEPPKTLDFSLVKKFLSVSKSNPKVGAILFACVARSVLYTAHPIDFFLFIYGSTGAKKSSVVAIALSFLGYFTGATMPANWNSTVNAIEMISHQAQDSPYCIDDLKFTGGTAMDSARMKSTFERIAQSIGNQSGRDRLNADSTKRPSPHNRGMPIITGEDLSGSSSTLGRGVVVSIGRNDIDVQTLTELQTAARDGKLAEIMSLYIVWLTGKMDSLSENLHKKIVDRRTAAIAQGFANSHARSPDIFASLMAGIDVFFQFCVETKAIDHAGANDAILDIENNLKSAFIEQRDYQEETDICTRFIALLASALASGAAHLAAAETDHIPTQFPERYGWRRGNGIIKRSVDERTLDAQHGDVDGRFFQYEPGGTKVGWVSGEEIYLNPESAFAAAQAVAKQQGEPITTSKNTVLKQMVERELIVATSKRETGSVISTVTRRVNGTKRRVAVINAETLFDG